MARVSLRHTRTAVTGRNTAFSTYSPLLASDARFRTTLPIQTGEKTSTPRNGNAARCNDDNTNNRARAHHIPFCEKKKKDDTVQRIQTTNNRMEK